MKHELEEIEHQYLGDRVFNLTIDDTAYLAACEANGDRGSRFVPTSLMTIGEIMEYGDDGKSHAPDPPLSSRELEKLREAAIEALMDKYETEDERRYERRMEGPR